MTGHVAAVPVPYRTTEGQPTFVALRDDDGGQAFPIALDPFTATRFELAEFAATAREMDVNFIGVCCGGAPHHAVHAVECYRKLCFNSFSLVRI